MLDFLKEMNDDDIEYDAIFFLPGEKPNTLQIEGSVYKDPGEKTGGGVMGDGYHIIIFRENAEEDKLYDIDRFDAVLTHPIEYISRMIKDNWFGIVAKKTTTSNNFIQNTFDKLKESC
jgi:hypothetical protein